MRDSLVVGHRTGARREAAHGGGPGGRKRAPDQIKAAGLVTLPGMFVGLVLGGASPAEAARIQLVVLLALLAVQLVAAVTCARLVVAGLTLPGERVIVPPASAS